MSVLRRALVVVHRIEDGVLAMLLMLMISLAFTQIVLRNGFDGGILWADSLLRMLVLWIALIGAVVGSRERQHISMDLVTRFLTGRSRQLVSFLTGVFAALVCGVLAWYSLDFVRIEYESGTVAFSGVPAWLCESVMPVAFAVMAIRYLLQAMLTMSGASPELGS